MWIPQPKGGDVMKGQKGEKGEAGPRGLKGEPGGLVGPPPLTPPPPNYPDFRGKNLLMQLAWGLVIWKARIQTVENRIRSTHGSGLTFNVLQNNHMVEKKNQNTHSCV